MVSFPQVSPPKSCTHLPPPPYALHAPPILFFPESRLRLKYDGTRAETRFRLSAKRTSPFKSAGASVQSTAGSRGVRISGSNAGYNMFRGSVKSTGYPLHSPVFPYTSPPVRHRVSSGFKRTVPNTKICCGFFRTVFPSSGRRQYSGSFL